MNKKEQLIILVDKKLKREFKIECIKDASTMTKKIIEFMKKYSKSKKELI